MTDMDIINIDDLLQDKTNSEDEEALTTIIEEFKRNHFPNVLSKSKAFRESYEGDNAKLIQKLLKVEAICHAQIGENRAASDIIRGLYQDKTAQTSSELILLGELAFMSDYKLARRITSEAVTQMEQEEETDRIKLARGYLVLGEAEENLEKLPRAIKYYKQGLTYFQEDDRRDAYMILYLHFKIGMLYTMRNDAENAVAYLEEVIVLAGEEHLNMKINSLVSIAKTYGSEEKNEQAFPYLEKALNLLPESSLESTMVHAEAMTEMAFYYFDQSKLEEAVPYYKEALTMYEKIPEASARKVGMIYMQYAYCLEHKEKSNKSKAGQNYERAIEKLEKANDRELLENALADVIAFFDVTGNEKKKRFYENKFVKMTNAN
ncbi:tetratricopeptide repeat protein [Oceanobacillus halotolerans]|uniref:tetratricopeptide repeat protein n=1 Tax=Oceanobacillus halotolerans TaxID=2663380 RepID=UPI0013D9BD5B|nr:tetratricopeptide repeat protein [Oceanobacillus halotolerans]